MIQSCHLLHILRDRVYISISVTIQVFWWPIWCRNVTFGGRCIHLVASLEHCSVAYIVLQKWNRVKCEVTKSYCKCTHVFLFIPKKIKMTAYSELTAEYFLDTLKFMVYVVETNSSISVQLQNSCHQIFNCVHFTIYCTTPYSLLRSSWVWAIVALRALHLTHFNNNAFMVTPKRSVMQNCMNSLLFTLRPVKLNVSMI